MIDESADCGCRRIQPDGGEMKRVIWCPDHPGECPGPWHPTRIGERFDDELDDYEPGDPWMDDDDYEWDRAMEECGKVPAAGGGCLNAGTEYCDFECPFRDDDEEDEPNA